MQARAHHWLSWPKNTTRSSIAKQADVIPGSSRSSKQRGRSTRSTERFAFTADADSRSHADDAAVFWSHMRLGERFWELGESLSEACTAKRIGHSPRWRSSIREDIRDDSREDMQHARPGGRVADMFIRELGRATLVAAVGCTSNRAATARSHCPLRPSAAMTRKAPACYHRRNALIGHMYAYVPRRNESACSRSRLNANLKDEAWPRHKGNAAANAGDSSRSRWLLHDGDAR